MILTIAVSELDSNFELSFNLRVSLYCLETYTYTVLMYACIL